MSNAQDERAADTESTSIVDAEQAQAGAGGVEPIRNQRSRRAGWWTFGLTVLILTLTVALGFVPVARSQGWLVGGGSATIAPEQLEKLQPQPSGAGRGVIGEVGALNATKNADAAKLSAAINSVQPPSKGTFAGAAADLRRGELGYAANADLPMTPASTLKFLTSTAALEVLEPSSRFRTRVVASTVDQVTTLTLVGGGDPLLASTPDSHPYRAWTQLPTLTQLTEQTVGALRVQGTSKVRVAFDDSLFVGPAWHPTWHAEDRAWVAPVTALAVDLGNPVGQETIKDPSEAAARVFISQLKAAGIEVEGDPTRAQAGSGSLQVAEVFSVPLLTIIEELMAVSDNYVTEVVARQTALAVDAEPSFTGAAKAVQDQLSALGLWADGQVISDGSGLSEANRITARTLVKAMQLAVNSPRQGYLVSTLPTAGATGTMTRRFGSDAAASGRGMVRAKTGSLDDVSSLVGYTPTKDGALVAFAFIGNALPKDQDNRPWFDQVSSTIAGCECGS